MSVTHSLPSARPARGLRLVGRRALHTARSGLLGLIRGALILLGIPLLFAALLLGLSLLQPAWLAVRQVALRGCELTDPPELLAVLPWHSGGRDALLPAILRRPDYAGLPWVAGLRLRPAGLRGVVAEVVERHPIARVQLAGQRQWVCDDGALVAINRQRDARLVPVLKDVPLIEIAGDAPPTPPALLALANAAVACKLDAPGQIASLRYTAEGQVELTHACGIYIRMGGLEGLGQRMAALPKVLRSCADERGELRGIDASDPCVFYKEWRSAPPQLKP